MAGRAEQPESPGWTVATAAEPTPPSWFLADVAYDSAWNLPPVDETAATARRLVATACSSFGMNELADDAALLTSELVTNAVRHASEPIELHVGRHRGGVVVAVKDDSDVMPVIPQLEQYGERGRGIRLVDALAVQWGIEKDPSPGKTFWFHLAGVISDC